MSEDYYQSVHVCYITAVCYPVGTHSVPWTWSSLWPAMCGGAMQYKQAQVIPAKSSHCKSRNVDNLQSLPISARCCCDCRKNTKKKAKETLHFLYSVEFLCWPVTRRTHQQSKGKVLIDGSALEANQNIHLNLHIIWITDLFQFFTKGATYLHVLLWLM